MTARLLGSRLVGTMSLFPAGDVVRASSQRARHTGLGEGTGVPSCGDSAGPVCTPAGLSLRPTGRIPTISGDVLLAALFTFGLVEARRLGEWPQASQPFYQAAIAGRPVAGPDRICAGSGLGAADGDETFLPRPALDGLLEALKAPIREEEEYLASAARQMGNFMGAEASAVDDPRLHELDLNRAELVSELVRYRTEFEEQGIEAIVPLRIPSGGGKQVLLGRRSGDPLLK